LPGIRIGQLLVEQGVLSDVQVEHLLKVQKESGRPFGDLAERIYGISPKAVEDAWVEQYIRTAGVVDLNEIKVESDCLRLLNRRQAWQFRVLPTNREEGEVNVATTPQNLVRAVNFATRSLDEPVYFMLAEHEQLREFLMKHYPVPEFLAQFSEKF
jgi:Type II secretion system (T2SS), protein E, N-terminal domain